MPVAKESGGDFKPAPLGTHFGRCFAVISLGTQPPGDPKFNPSFKVLLMWELSNRKMDNGDCYTVIKEYTNSLNPKANLRKDLESWRGRPFTQKELEGFSVEKVIGTPAMLTVIHNPKKSGGVSAKVNGVAVIPEGMTVPELQHKPVHYELEWGIEDQRFQELPEWVRKKIGNCLELNPHAAAVAEPEPVDEKPAEDDVPFSFVLPQWIPIVGSAAAGLLA